MPPVQSADDVGPANASRTDSLWALWAVSAAFGTYFCMYAFRKPFTAAGYGDVTLWGTSLKSLLVISQVLGYTISKFIGIRVIAEMRPERRAAMLLLLVGTAELALILFGLVPAPLKPFCMFLNGIPLGMVFGLVLGFLEGRQITEALSAGLCTSFILADGATKSVGAWLLKRGVPEYWMPAAAGGLFLVPLAVCVLVLARTPTPTSLDIAARSQRVQMNRSDRWALMRRFGPGLLMLVMMYLLVTILRSIRADFAPEIWRGLGEPAAPSTFTTSEMLVALGVLIVNGSLMFIRDNRRAFFVALGTCVCGFILIMAALLSLRWGSGIGAFPFMVLVGFGLYLPYVAVHTTIFERLLAMTRERGNVGFLMYLADSTGYLGYVGCMLGKGLINQEGEFLPFFTSACWITCCVSIACLLISAWYFRNHGEHQTVLAVIPQPGQAGSEQDTSSLV